MTLRLSILASTMLLSLGLGMPAQAQQAPNMTFFVTSVGPGKGADLGGLAGADAYCQSLAATAHSRLRPGAPCGRPSIC